MNKLKLIKFLLIGAIALALVLAVWPYKIVASPNADFHIVAADGKPLIGVRIERHWDTSEGQKGEDETTSDTNGHVNFKRVEFSISWLKRMTKPLLIVMPAICGGNWQVYGHAQFNIFWPLGYTVKFDDGTWKKMDAMYENRDGIHIYDPKLAMNKDYLGLYVFNKRSDFDYTLTLFRSLEGSNGRAEAH